MKLEIHYAEEWAALYQDGQLVRVGDTYATEEKAFELLGVETVQDDAFMRGQNYSQGVAKTLEEVEEYRKQREEAKELAAEKRAQAARLLSEAAALESK
jgi:hypothetical protein